MELELVDGRQYLVRNVNRSVHHLRSWISAVGAAVAVEDLNGDGFPNDACWVCPRLNRVVITKVGAAGKNYQPRFLDPPTFSSFNNQSTPGGPNTIAPMGCLIGDFNEDGALDVVAYFWGRSPVVFLRNSLPWTDASDSANDHFDPVEVCSPPERWFTNAATQTDLDGDGHIDLIFGNYFADGATVLDPDSATPVEMQASMSHATNGGRTHFMLWKRQPNLSAKAPFFREAEVKLFNGRHEVVGRRKEDLLRGWTLALATANFDANPFDLPGVYLGNDFGHDVLLLPEIEHRMPGTLSFRVAKGARDWTAPKSKTLGHDSFKGMGACPRDFDGDGLPDISVSNIAAKWALLESHFAFASGRLAIHPNLKVPSTDGELRQIVSSIRARYYGDVMATEKVMPLQDLSEEMGLARSGWGWDVKAGSFDNGTRLQFVRAQGFIQGHHLSRLNGARSQLAQPSPMATGRWAVLHELATANDAALSSPNNWFTCQPGDDLSGRDLLAFHVADNRGRYFDQNSADITRRLITSTHRNAPAELGKGPLPIDPLMRPMIARGIALADVDGNGMLDFVVANQGLHQVEDGDAKQFESSYCFINRSPAAESNSCFVLRLLLPLDSKPHTEAVQPSGRASAAIRGRPAIGATATFIADTPEGPKIFSDTVDGGSGHSGKNSFDLHFGLGKELDIDQPIQVLVRWRDPRTRDVREEVFSLTPGRPGDPEAGYRHTILLGAKVL